MNITKNQIDDLNATIKIELGKEDYAGRVEKALKDYQKKVVVNGFRPGKTPMGIVKKMYGKSLLVDEINKVLGESLNNYIKENNLQILGEPLPNETEQKELNLEEFEVSPTTGKIEDMYGPMFGGPANSPSIFPGFGKVISMTQTI